MASMRCTTCSIEYPTTIEKCPACDEDTWYNKDGVQDEFWSWKAQLNKQRREAGQDATSPGTQPYFMTLTITEIIGEKADVENDESGLNRGELKVTPAIGLVEVYAYEGRKLLLKPDDVIELPDPERKGHTKLYEVQGTFHAPSGTMYMLRRMLTRNTVPQEWVEEYYRGAD